MGNFHKISTQLSLRNLVWSEIIPIQSYLKIAVTLGKSKNILFFQIRWNGKINESSDANNYHYV